MKAKFRSVLRFLARCVGWIIAIPLFIVILILGRFFPPDDPPFKDPRYD